jgi:hypothetical protein
MVPSEEFDIAELDVGDFEGELDYCRVHNRGVRRALVELLIYLARLALIITDVLAIRYASNLGSEQTPGPLSGDISGTQADIDVACCKLVEWRRSFGEANNFPRASVITLHKDLIWILYKYALDICFLLDQLLIAIAR